MDRTVTTRKKALLEKCGAFFILHAFVFAHEAPALLYHRLIDPVEAARHPGGSNPLQKKAAPAGYGKSKPLFTLSIFGLIIFPRPLLFAAGSRENLSAGLLQRLPQQKAPHLRRARVPVRERPDGFVF